MRFENTEFDFDITDADTYEAVNELNKNWKASLENLKSNTCGDNIRALNGCVKAFLDCACGEGVHEKIFGGRTSMAKTVKLFTAIIGEVKKQTQEMSRLVTDLNGDDK